MKQKYGNILAAACLLICMTSPEKPADAVGRHGKQQEDKLTEKVAQSFAAYESEKYLKDMADSLEEMWSSRKLKFNGLEMPFKIRIIGEKPEGGRSLYISMHGGGAVAKEFNDSQWENQIHLYTPEEGVYIAPRAPYDDWNMWFRKEIDDFFSMLITAAVIFENVNPDKVYLTGYSAGGDGVWRLAPRMADKWAAAAMMAGHPGESSLLNLRNLPFMIWMGENDSAYDRNTLAEIKGRELDSLQTDDPDGYIHETHIVKGCGHWMNRADTAAISWMAQFTRNVIPDRIVWRQEDVARATFYWLKVPMEEAQPGMKVTASIRDNTIYIDECDYNELYICLNDSLADLDRKVRISYKGRILFNGKVFRKRETIRKSLLERNDPKQIYCSEIHLTDIR